MEVINKSDCAQFVAKDEAIVREIVSPRNSSARNQSLAEVTIPSGVSILTHYHKKTEEVYFILAGTGKMQIEGEERNVGVDDAIVILPGEKHGITNTGRTDLVFLVTCSPSYEDDDQVLI